MTKSKIMTMALVAVAFLAVGTAAPARAGELSAGLQAQLAGQAADEEVTVLVVLRQRADIAGLDRNLHAAKAPLARRHQMVVGALRATAEGSQGPLVADLDRLASPANKSPARVAGYTPHWIVNAIVVRATVAAVRELALREDVEVVEANLEVELIEPVSVKTDVPRPVADKSGYVPPGVIAVGARRVWNELGITGAGTIVANMDSGVDGEHPALAARWQGKFAPVRSAWRDIAGTGARYFPADFHGHGTHVMGTITGATAFDTLGVAPGAHWIANNAVFSAFEGYDNKIISGFEFTADPDGNPATHDDVPDVMHNSWGVRVGDGYIACDSRWWDAIDHCEAAGVVVTFSAGNEGPAPMTLRSPGDRATSPTSCFTVGSTAKETPFGISDFSSRGPSACGGPNAIKPEVMAPGDDIYSSLPGGGYGYMSGTSMAGPHVAGVVALMREAAPDLDVTAIKEILMATAVDLGAPGEDNAYGWGFVDAYAAVSLVLGNSGVVAGTVTDAQGGQPVPGVVVQDLRGQTRRTTDAAGDFSFRVLGGPTTLRVAKFGYRTLELPVVVPGQGGVELPIAFEAMRPAAVEGIVRDPAGQPVEGATVMALGTPLPPAISNRRGLYRLDLPSGTGVSYDLLATAPGLAYALQPVWLEDDRNVDFALAAPRGDGFESGDFSALPWQRTGQAAWSITDLQAFDGARSARTGAIAHGGATTLTLAHYTNGTGDLSFRVRTDSEITYDMLKFFVDGELLGSWSGATAWTEFRHELAPGQHSLKWEYRKDSSVSIGEDTAWIDQVDLPGSGQAPQAVLDFAADPVALTLAPVGTGSRKLALQNVGNAPLTFTAGFLGTAPAWCVVQPAYGVVQSYNTTAITLAFDGAQALPGANVALFRLATNDPARAATHLLVTLTVDAAAGAGSPVPAELVVHGAVPNPFNPYTEIVFALPTAGVASVRLFDVSGRLVRTLADGELPAGENRLRWDGNDDRGRALASGVYYLRVEIAGAAKGAALSLVR